MPSEWERIKQIFEEALEVAPAERGAFLRRACAGDETLRQTIGGLLANHDAAAPDFLDAASRPHTFSPLFGNGQRIAGRFTVVRPIAAGAVGEVYEVFDEQLQLRVALKAIRPDLLRDRQTGERFKREVWVTREVAHEGLCRVFDFVEHHIPRADGAGTHVVPCLTMQLLEGESLDEYLAAHRPLPLEAARSIVRQIGGALQVLHDRGIVHRDLKPSNVILVPQPGGGHRAVLTDFGLAKPLVQSGFESRCDVQGGAPYFMAPELFRGEGPSRASDIYALGLLLDEMVTHERAFNAESLHTLFVQKLGARPTRPSHRASRLPASWERTILRCLESDPRRRVARADDVAGALEVRPEDAAARAPAPRRWWSGLREFVALPGDPPRARSWWRPIVYASLMAPVAAAAVTLGTEAFQPVETSVAVFPFANLTTQPEFEHLGRGTVGELSRRLSQIDGMRVYPVRHSRTTLTTPLTAITLSLEGHIQQADERARLTVQLLRNADGTLVWSQNFDGTLSQSLALQQEVSEQTLRAIERWSRAGDEDGESPRRMAWLSWPFAQLLPWRGRGLPPSATTHSEAFESYIRGRSLWEERTLPAALHAREYLQRAVAADPTFALAYATLADLQGVLMDFNHAPHGDLLAEARGYAEQAVALDPGLPEAHASLAAVRQMLWDWQGSEQAYQRAIWIYPNFARAHRWYAGLLLQFGRHEAALRLARRAMELDPFDHATKSGYGFMLFYAGQPEAAAEHLERQLAQRDFLYARAILGQVYAALGAAGGPAALEYRDKALREADRLRELETSRGDAGAADASVTKYADLVAALAWAYQRDAASAAPFLDRLEQGRTHHHVSAATVARVYAALGHTATALQYLEEAEAARDRELLNVKVAPFFRPLHQEPRFQALLRRMSL